MSMKRIHRVLEIATEAGMNIDWADDYAEPGYTKDGDGPILFSNWNNGSTWREETADYPERVSALFEKLGCTIEWSDEWYTCIICGRAIRIVADSYCWTPSYHMFNDCEPVCHECIAEDPESYLMDIEGDQRKAVCLDIDPSEHGYFLYETGLENGFHPGQNDDPHAIADEMKKRGLDRFLFEVDSVGQFDVSFKVWIHKDNVCEIEEG